MGRLKLFEEFTVSENSANYKEEITRVFDKLSKWAESRKYKFSANFGAEAFYVYSELEFEGRRSLWHFKYDDVREKTTSFNYGPSYKGNPEKGKAWYIMWPAEYSRVSGNDNYKKCSPESFMKLMDITMKADHMYKVIVDFLRASTVELNERSLAKIYWTIKDGKHFMARMSIDCEKSDEIVGIYYHYDEGKELLILQYGHMKYPDGRMSINPNKIRVTDFKSDEILYQVAVAFCPDSIIEEMEKRKGEPFGSGVNTIAHMKRGTIKGKEFGF